MSAMSRCSHRTELLCPKKNPQTETADHGLHWSRGSLLKQTCPPQVTLFLGRQMCPPHAGLYRRQVSNPAAGSPGWSRCAPQSREQPWAALDCHLVEGSGRRPDQLGLMATPQFLLSYIPLSSPALLIHFLLPGSRPAASLEYLGLRPVNL